LKHLKVCSDFTTTLKSVCRGRGLIETPVGWITRVVHRKKLHYTWLDPNRYKTLTRVCPFRAHKG